MSLVMGPWLGLDFESSGGDPLTARIVTACVAYRSENDSGWTKEWLADAGGEIIPDGAIAVHGISTERAHADGQPVIDVAEEVRERLQDAWAVGVPVVAMNASYDLSLLNAELVRANHRPLSIDGPVLDPLVLDRMVDKYRRGSRKLPDLCTHCDVPHTAAAPGEDASLAAGAHDATADTLAALRVLWRIGKSYPALAKISLSELHERQIAGHEAWAAGFEAHLRSQGKPDVIERSWPLRVAAEASR